MSQTLIVNGTIVTMDSQQRVPEGGSLLIESKCLAAVAPGTMKQQPEMEVVEAQGKIVLPGLVNTHVHTSQQLGRGLADDVPLLTWLHDRIWPYESNMTGEDS